MSSAKATVALPAVLEADQNNLSVCLPKCMCASMFISDHEYTTCMLVITALTNGNWAPVLNCHTNHWPPSFPAIASVRGIYTAEQGWVADLPTEKPWGRVQSHSLGAGRSGTKVADWDQCWEAKDGYRDVGRFWCDDWCWLSSWQTFGITWEMPLVVLVRDYPDYANWRVQKS